MKALVLNGPGTPLSIGTVNDPSPEKGYAVAKVLACGSGLTIQHVKAGRIIVDYPRIIGHEIIAEIVEINGVSNEYKVGDPVTAFFYLTCGQCKWCNIDRETLCNNFKGYIGREIDGGYAEYIKLPIENFIKIPESINYKYNLLETAVVCDAVATPLKVIKKARISSFDKVGVIGAGGGLGIHMLKMLKLNNISTVGIDTKTEKFDVCNENGAEFSISPMENDLNNKIADYTQGNDLDVVIDFVSSKSSLELGTSILGKGGRLVTLGGSGEQFLANSADMLVKELELIGSRYCTKQELKESLNLYARGLVKPLVSHKTDFNGAEELHNKIETGDITGRAGILI